MSHLLQFPLAALVTAVLVSASPAQPGSYSKQSTTSDGVVAAAKFAVETQSKKSPVTLIKILSAESQVVAGHNIRMTLEVRTKSGNQHVVAVVWNKLDGTQELTNWDVKGGGNPEKKTEKEPIDGGYVKVATTDEGVVASAKFAVAAHFKKEPATLLKILSAESQIVAGRNFRMTLEVRTKAGDLQAVAVVWNKLDGAKELTRWDVKKDMNRPNVGGYSSVATTDEGVVEAAKFAIATQSKKEPVTLVKIESAERQVVAGSNTRMSLEVRTKDGLRHAEAVVWRKIGGEMELTQWQWKAAVAPKK